MTLPADAVRIAMGGFNGAAVLANGTVATWGANFRGQIGDGRTPAERDTPFVVPGLTGVTQIAAGVRYSLALRSDGTVWAWGWNNDGQLGDGTTVDRSRPERLAGLTGVTRLIAGDHTSYALKAGGTLLSIGRPAPRVPSVIGQTQAEAAQTLQGAGYTLGRVAFIVDLTCEYIGEVKTQSPAAGSIAAPGTSVSVGIGKPGGKCL